MTGYKAYNKELICRDFQYKKEDTFYRIEGGEFVEVK